MFVVGLLPGCLLFYVAVAVGLRQNAVNITPHSCQRVGVGVGRAAYFLIFVQGLHVVCAMLANWQTTQLLLSVLLGHLAAYYLLPSACCLLLVALCLVGLLVVVLKHSWANI